MQETKKKLGYLALYLLILMSFTALTTQNFSEAESNSTKSIWQFHEEQTAPILSHVAVDGYVWRKMPEAQKYGYITGYLMGFRAGFYSAWVAATGDKYLSQSPFTLIDLKMSFGELTEAVDEFYSDYANRGICVSLALPIIIGRSEGYISDEKAKERIQNYRRSVLKEKQRE